MNSTASSRFHQRAAARGLTISGISSTCVELLIQMDATPLPPAPVKRHSDGKNRRPSTSAALGPLINRELARFNGSHYVPTEKGRDYLKQLRRAKLIP